MVKRYLPEEAQWNISHDSIDIYTCPDCAFGYDATHEQDDSKGGYICPVCEVEELKGN